MTQERVTPAAQLRIEDERASGAPGRFATGGILTVVALLVAVVIGFVFEVMALGLLLGGTLFIVGQLMVIASFSDWMRGMLRK